jgi:hypothetical protein
MANLKSFEQFVSEMDRAEEIEKDVVDAGTPEQHDEEEADAVQSQGQEANEANDVTGIEADQLKDDSKDVTPPVVDAEGTKYAKAEDRAEDDSAELNKDLKDQADGENIGKEVTEKKSDGTISDDEEEKEDALMSHIESTIDALVKKIKDDANEIGGSFRAPGIEHRAAQLIKAKLQKAKLA